MLKKKPLLQLSMLLVRLGRRQLQREDTSVLPTKKDHQEAPQLTVLGSHNQQSYVTPIHSGTEGLHFPHSICHIRFSSIGVFLSQ